MSERALDVFINDRTVGTLLEENDLWKFVYDPAWVAAADSYDLSPHLDRRESPHVDGASVRPVQWYFDNLLPEEALRTVLSKEAEIPEADAFGLLEYFGAESAGSLVLRAPPNSAPAKMGLRELPDEVLYQRILNLPRLSLNHDSPKHMSLAGAQHKLPVVYRDGKLYEPEAGDVSTHILKPNHPGEDYPSSVINEYFVMRLAQAVGLNVPNVHRHYCPAPVYIIDRFDRVHGNDSIQRLHIIDTCQLLNKSRAFKYTEASVETLTGVMKYIRTKTAARLWLFQWLVFNVLVGNSDNHLKNISFMVSVEGVNISPGYDLLSTAGYTTRAIAQDRTTWPNVSMALPLPDANTFSEVTRLALLSAGRMLGLTAETAKRELDRMVQRIVPAADELMAEIEYENANLSADVHPYLAGELRVLRAIRHIIIQEMVMKLRPESLEPVQAA
jgi:serine/threonine-protein kinase HipA